MQANHVHLIGIGGTGMTALAGLLGESGCRVTGSDGALYPPTSTILERLGFEVHVGFDPSNLEPTPELVVVGNAISRGNVELEHVLERRLPYTSMPQLIEQRFLPGRHSMVVAGTHGKTTTTSMLAWVLTHAGRDPGFMIGGLPCNFDDSFHLGTGAEFVIEGDEYDSAFFDKGPKFMHYRPDTAILGTVEFDHADIYRDLNHIETVFGRLVNLVPSNGRLVYHADCEPSRRIAADAFCPADGFGSTRGTWRFENFEESADGSSFTIVHEGSRFADVRLALAGEHNARNALAVAAAAHARGVEAATIAQGLDLFRGVRRRQETRGVADGVTVLDDFAHHPTAVRATLAAVRRRWPEGRVWAVLEPRSWSMRRNVFQERLVEAFDDAGEIVIASVYLAESIPLDERLDPGRLASDLRARGLSAEYLPAVSQIVERIGRDARPGDVVAIMTNGAFEGLHDRLLEAFAARVEAAREA